MSTKESAVHTSFQEEHDEGYHAFEKLIADRVANAPQPLFTTSPPSGRSLFEVYLDSLPPARRQHYNCNHCRRFVEKYGGLVHIDADGRKHTLLWGANDDPDFFVPATAELSRLVLKSRIDGVFLSSEETWGTPSNVAGHSSKYVGVRWTHLSGTNLKPFKHALLTAEQVMAEKREDHTVLCRGLAEFNLDAIQEAVRVLEADALPRSEKALEIARWFLGLKELKKGPSWNALVWRAVATAPPGFCHVKNTVLGTLLADIAAGLGYDACLRRWKDKVHPLQYQRPTTLKVGNLEAAERLVEKLGVARSLERRWATLDDVTSIWRPKEQVEEEEEVKPGGVFGHLKAKAGQPPVQRLALPAKTLTWVRFLAEVLPSASRIEVKLPSRGGYYGLTAALHTDAPPILQWDGLEGMSRNTVAWYFYYGGSTPREWGFDWLSGGTPWVDCPSISYKPPHWQAPEKFAHQDWGVMFALKGARDVRKDGGEKGNALFPECLRADLREARAAIEAYSKEATLAGAEVANANGLAFGKDETNWNLTLRVNDQDEFYIDRWE